jgi:hypothetical protein
VGRPGGNQEAFLAYDYGKNFFPYLLFPFLVISWNGVNMGEPGHNKAGKMAIKR